MKNITFYIIVLFFISCSGTIKINNSEIKKVKKTAVLTFYHTVWIKNKGLKLFPVLLNKIVNSPNPYTGFPLLRDGLPIFLNKSKNKCKIKFINFTDNLNLDEIKIYKRKNILGEFYYIDGNRKSYLYFKGKLKNKNKLKKIIFKNKIQSITAIRINIEITFNNYFQDKLNMSVKTILNVKMLNKNLKTILNYNKNKVKKIINFKPENGDNLGVLEVIYDFFKFLNQFSTF